MIQAAVVGMVGSGRASSPKASSFKRTTVRTSSVLGLFSALSAHFAYGCTVGQVAGENFCEPRRAIAALGPSASVDDSGANVVLMEQQRDAALGDRLPTAPEVTPFAVRVGGERGNELGGRDVLARGEYRMQGVEQPAPLGRTMALAESVTAALRACLGQVPPARSAIANSRRQFVRKRLLNPAGMTGSRPSASQRCPPPTAEPCAAARKSCRQMWRKSSIRSSGTSARV